MGCVEGFAGIIIGYDRILTALLLFSCGLPHLISAVQDGFISIDCGCTKIYNDSNGIEWSSDEGYIQTGETASVQNPEKYNRTLKKLRFFSGEQDKNCYVLQPLTVGRKYLIRAIFLYGNYDNRSTPPAFTLLFDANVWSNVITKISSFGRHEMIMQARKSSVSVCLLRTNPVQNPFISSLELREMPPEMYQVVAGNSFGVMLDRINFGAESNQSIIRYPADPFDRIWHAYRNDRYTDISTGEYIHQNSPNKVPMEVLQTAITTSNASQMIALTRDYGGVKFVAYVIAYFAEIQEYSQGIRAFDVYMNGGHWYNFSSGLHFSDVKEISSNFTLTDPIEFELVAKEGSTLGPLLNAWECYHIRQAVEETFSPDVETLNTVKASFNLEDWTGDPCLPISYSWKWVNCSSDSPPRITALWLSNKGLDGPIPDFSSLTELQTLDLQHNNLSGPLPEFLAHLPKLIELNVGDNNLSGPVPRALQNNQKLSMNISGNPFLCLQENATCTNKETVTGHSRNRIKGRVKFGIIVAGAAVLVVLSFAFAIMRTSSKGGRASRSSSTLTSNPNAARGFTYSEVRAATNNFSRKIGEGGFGPVFYGCLPEGQEVAMKVLSTKSQQGSNEFSAEVAALSRIHHKNLVSLVGFCTEQEHRILIYEYISMGSLRHILHGPSSSGALLDWRTRLNVALNASQGLEYLHMGCNPAIIHRDVKSDNILLNHKLLAKVSDFGLSKVVPIEGATHVSTFVKGTAGYLDPEYYTTNQLTEKSDVYSFGVLLLEIICGRPPNNMQLPPEQRNVIEWVRLMVSRGNIEAIVDPILSGNNYNVGAMWKVVELAMACTEAQSANRPTMGDVVYELKEAIRLEMAMVPSISMGSWEIEPTSPAPLLLSADTQLSNSYSISNAFPSAR